MKAVGEVFVAFLKIGSLTFGGGYAMLPLLYREVAEKQGWATEEEINDYYALSQCLPGIIAIKTAGLVGYKRCGPAGMLAASVAVTLPALLASMVIALFIEDMLQFPLARHAVGGIRIAVLALVIDAVLKMWKVYGGKSALSRKLFGIILFGVLFLAALFLSLSPVWLVLAGGLAGLMFGTFAKGAGP